MAMSLGTRIKAARDRLRWSQQELADAIGVTPRTISNWEQGHTPPSRAYIRLLEQVLGPLEGAPEDLLTIAEAIRNSSELSAGQRQALLALIDAQPHGRHLFPALVSTVP